MAHKFDTCTHIVSCGRCCKMYFSYLNIEAPKIISGLISKKMDIHILSLQSSISINKTSRNYN